jgi:hypothetical protein
LAAFLLEREAGAEPPAVAEIEAEAAEDEADETCGR